MTGCIRETGGVIKAEIDGRTEVEAIGEVDDSDAGPLGCLSRPSSSDPSATASLPKMRTS